MMRLAIVLAASATLAACSAGPRPDEGRARFLGAAGNPSTVITTELAFAREASDKGTWTAFRHYAASDAIWAGPQWESVQAALKRVADPAQPIIWEPDRVWVSCDGSYALSTGPSRQPNGRDGRFTTIWQRQHDGSYRWVLDQGFTLDSGYEKPEMIAALVADCPPGKRPQKERTRRALPWQAGASDDGTLTWSTTLFPDCRRELVVKARRGTDMIEVFRRTSTVPNPPGNGPMPVCA